MLNTIDFRNVSDTGEPEAPAIQPITDGEPAGQVAFRRPTENARARTDVLRQVVREHVVLQDVQAELLSGGGTITFDGARTSYSGKVHLGADLTVLPFATPGGSVTAPYVQSTKASRVLIGANVTDDILTFTSRYYQWQRPSGGAAPDWAAEADQISVEIVHTGTLSVTVSGAASKQTNVYITIDYGVTTCQQVMDAVVANTDADKLVVVTYTGAGDPATALSPRFTTTEWGGDYSARFLRGGAPGLAHVITDDVLNNVSAGFFNLHVENPLKKGDTLAIWYDALVNLAATGGRLQSTPENLNIAIPATAIFNTRREPEKIPNCIPLCKCLDDNTLIFVDGSRIIRGTPASLWWDSQHILSGSSSPIDYSAWTRVRYAPGVHVPPTTVQQALDNVDDIFEAVLNGSQAFVSTGAHPGITSTGNTSYPGVKGTGGATAGSGVYGEGGGAGVGVEGVGGATGGLTAIGVKGTGVGSGDGVHGYGGATSGDGVYGESPANNGVHGKAVGGGGYGVKGESTTNSGVIGLGGGTTGAGVEGDGAGASPAPGVRGTGGTDKNGVEGTGNGTGAGVHGTGGASGPGVSGDSFALNADQKVMIQLPLASFHADVEGDESTPIWRYNYNESGWEWDSWTMVNTGDSFYSLFGDFVLPQGFTTCGVGIRWKAETADLTAPFTCRFERARFTPSATIPAPPPSIIEIATVPHPQTSPDTIINTYVETGVAEVTFNHAATYSDLLRIRISSYTARRWIYQVWVYGYIAAPNCYHSFRNANPP